MGNFINGELWGRFASPDLPWGMVFAQQFLQPHTLAEVYQFLLEGLLLFVLLWLYARREPANKARWPPRLPPGLRQLRFIAEYFRRPTASWGCLSLGMSMGQWLCVPMVAAEHCAVGVGAAPAGGGAQSELHAALIGPTRSQAAQASWRRRRSLCRCLRHEIHAATAFSSVRLAMQGQKIKQLTTRGVSMIEVSGGVVGVSDKAVFSAPSKPWR